MSYVVFTSLNSKKKYDIVETDWNTRIELKIAKNEANRLARRLNLGNGFGSGPVPAFFCTKTSSS